MLYAHLTLALLFGLCIGSFLNVVIHRRPRGESIVRPGSFCPVCRHALGPSELVPVFSYLALRGECRHCGSSITPRYLLVEAAAALLFTLCVALFGWSLAALTAAALCSVSVICILVDIEHHMVLDEVLVAASVIALALNIPFAALCTWYEALLGAVAGGLPLLLVALVGHLLARRHVMGGGDIKFMAMAGLFLGWKLVLLAYALGCVAGGIAVLVLLLTGRLSPKQEVPFVPALAGGVLLSLFSGQQLLDWYFGLFA